MPLDATTYLPAPAVSDEAAIVRRMMELLKEPENWCQGKGFRGNAMCLLGAVANATPKETGIFHVVRRALTRECRQHVPDWNDAPGRTHADVLTMLARVLRRFEGV